MATGKRASMREGPLADLFRKTAEDTRRRSDTSRRPSEASRAGQKRRPARQPAGARGQAPARPPEPPPARTPRRRRPGAGRPHPSFESFVPADEPAPRHRALASGALASGLLGRHPRERARGPAAVSRAAPSAEPAPDVYARPDRPGMRSRRRPASVSRCCAWSASAAPASMPSTAWSRPRSRASSSWPSTPTCSRCSCRPPTRRCTSATGSPAVSARDPIPISAGARPARSTTGSRPCSAGRTWCSSPPVPAAARAPAQRPSSPRSPVSSER